MKTESPVGYIDISHSEKTAVCKPLFEFCAKIENNEIRSRVEISIAEINRVVIRLKREAEKENDIIDQKKELEARIVDLTVFIEDLESVDAADLKQIRSIREYINGMLIKYLKDFPKFNFS